MKLPQHVILIVSCIIGCTKGQSNYELAKQQEQGLQEVTKRPPSSNADHSNGSPEGGVLSPGYDSRDGDGDLSCNIFSEDLFFNASNAQCKCKRGFVGSPPNCTIGPQLWEACYNGNPCGPDSDCDMDDDGNRECTCMTGFYGGPPHCKSGHIRNKVCKDCGPNSKCSTFDTEKSLCNCSAGFVGKPPNCTAGPTLLKSCDPYPCGPNSQCEKRRGVATCSCLPGYGGEPPNCKPGPLLWRICYKERACELTDSPICTVHDRSPVCSACPQGYSGKIPYCLRD